MSNNEQNHVGEKLPKGSVRGCVSSPSPTPSTRDIMRAHLIILFCCGVLAKKPVHVPGWPELPFPFSTALIANNGAIHISGMQGGAYLLDRMFFCVLRDLMLLSLRHSLTYSQTSRTCSRRYRK